MYYANFKFSCNKAAVALCQCLEMNILTSCLILHSLIRIVLFYEFVIFVLDVLGCHH